MERALSKFYNLLDVANAYKGNLGLYLFLRDCAFRGIFETMSSNIVQEDVKQKVYQLYNEFQGEISQYQWNFFSMQKEIYSQFLEFFYSNINFDTADEKLLTVCLDILENLRFFGTYDDLALKRSKQYILIFILIVEYFNKKINNLKMPSQINPQSQISNMNQQPKQPQMNPAAQQQMNYNQGNLSSNQNNNKPFVPINNNGRLPRKVRPEFRLPMSKSDPQYPQLRDQIAEHIEYANLELDYHKITEAREHLEAAAYYLKNVTD